ncbi:hypothetical protein J8F10_22085 [Gemmata sp. G18]|uniref:Uncharacterized protein n=1 Tax=Gemmata palustris TaxID=2822762 RepID=A0ABS5BWA2_9BACT|nr:hypothetical protein [Gemmata palustris]MBP3957953.1 hypothetical protein [Gemmata palustris]
MTADPRSRWAEHLSVPVGAPTDVALAHFLRALPGDDFLPPPERAAAVNALTGSALPVGPDSTVEQMLRDEIELLADNYWRLEPAERLTTWAELSRRGAPPARLRDLEPGLDVPTPSLTDPLAVELAALFRVLFLMPPRDRAIRRNTWLIENATNMGQWRAALKVVLRDAPSLVPLDAQLYAALGRAGDLTELVEGVTAAPRPRSSASVDVADFAARVRKRGQWKPDPRGELSVLPLLFLGILFSLFVVCVVTGRSDRKPDSEGVKLKVPPIRIPMYTPPTNLSLPLKPAPSFTPFEIADCERYEREKAAGRDTRPPAIYSVWESIGRPGASGTKPPPPFRPIFSFDSALIRVCQEYDQTMTGSKPVFYEFWVKAGKPTKPGDYPITTDPN